MFGPAPKPIEPYRPGVQGDFPLKNTRYNSDKLINLIRNPPQLLEKPVTDLNSIKQSVYMGILTEKSTIFPMLFAITLGLVGSAIGSPITVFLGICAGLATIGHTVTKTVNIEKYIEKNRKSKAKEEKFYFANLADIVACRALINSRITSRNVHEVRQNEMLYYLSETVLKFETFIKKIENVKIGKAELKKNAEFLYLQIIELFNKLISEPDVETFKNIKFALEKFSTFISQKEKETVDEDSNELNKAIEELESSLEISRQVESKMQQLESLKEREKE